jgi:hypothetical protein
MITLVSAVALVQGEIRYIPAVKVATITIIQGRRDG